MRNSWQEKLKAAHDVQRTIGALLLKRFFLPISLIFFIIPSDAAETRAQEESIVAKIIDAYGGKENLSIVGSISAEGRIQKAFPNDAGTYSRYFKKEKKLFVDIRYQQSSERRILNGRKGYRGTSEKVEEVKGPPYYAMVYQYNQIDLPFGFLDGAFKVTGMRREKLNGVDADVLQLKDRDGYEIEIYVSTENFMILKAIGYFRVGSSITTLSAEFSDYRKVDGILWPHKIINYARGAKLSETVISKYEINPAIDESVFSP
jgi:hypothetical protein